MAEHLFEAIGTHWKIVIGDDLASQREAAVLEQVRARIDIFDRDYSRFRSDSLVTKMSQEEGEYTLPNDAQPMLDLYREMYDITGGLVTPLIGQMLSDAGYDPQYSLEPKALTAPPGWDDVLEYTFPKLIIKKPALLDFGAAGKGYLVDIVGEVLKQAGVGSFVVNAGGDILAHDAQDRPVRIGLEHPEDPSLAIGVASIANKSICGSAGNRRAWGEFHHILNPATLKPAHETAAVWVVADTAMLADAMATCLFFAAPSRLSRYSFEWLMMDQAGAVERSEQFPAELFTA